MGRDFRYVKVRIDYTNANDLSFMEVEKIRLLLDVKLRNDSGNGTAASGDVGGTTVEFNIPFVDVNSIQATPRGTSPVSSQINFVDAPNPTEFKVLLHDNDGNRVSGDFDWICRGV